MLRRTGFKRPDHRPQAVYTGERPDAPRAQPVRIDGPARLTVAVPKSRPKRSEKYRRWVATQKCVHCNHYPPSQCAHSDSATGSRSKGMGIKSCDSTCYPLCVACHRGIGSEGWFPKAERRVLEATYSAITRLNAKAAGVLPEGWE